MKHLLKSLSKDTLTYSLAEFLGKFVGLLMIPIYTFYLTPHDYGVLSLLLQINYLVTIFLDMGVEQTVVHFYYESRSKQEADRFLTTFLLTIMFISLVVISFLIYHADLLSTWMFKSRDYIFPIQLTLSAILAQVINATFMNFFKAEQKSLTYAIIQILMLIGSVFFNVMLIVQYEMGVQGILFSTLVVHIFASVGFLLYGLKRFKIRYHLSTTKRFLQYSVPLIGAGLGMLTLHSSDQFLIARLDSISSNGLYSLAARFGVLCNILITAPFQMAWLPKQFKIAHESPNPKLFSNMGTYLLLLMTTFSLFLSLSIKDILKIMVEPSFIEAHVSVPILLLSYIFYGLYIYFQFGLLFRKRTALLGISTMIAAGINIALNFLLIPYYSHLGAGIATLLANMLLAGFVYCLSNKEYPIAIQGVRAIKILATAIVLFLCSTFVAVDSIALSVVINLFLWLLYFPLLKVFKTFTSDEEIFIKNIFTRIPWRSLIPNGVLKNHTKIRSVR